MPLIASRKRLPVHKPRFWREIAILVVKAIPPWLRAAVAWDLRAGLPDATEAVRDMAELVLRTLPGRLSFAQGLAEGMLVLMALDLNPAAARAYRAQVLNELEKQS